MSKFAVGQVVWIKPLARRGIIECVRENGCVIKSALWGHAHLATIDERQQTLLREAINRRYVAHERSIGRLAIALSEPYECTFHTRADYRRAYIDWAYSFGHPDEIPSGVRGQYFAFLMIAEGS